MQTVAYLHSKQLQGNIIIHLEWCVWPPGECKTNIHSLSSTFGLHQIPLSLAAKCSTYVQQLVANYVCLVLSRYCTVAFYSFFFENSCLLRPKTMSSESEPNKKVVAGQLNNELKLSIKLCEDEGRCRFR